MNSPIGRMSRDNKRTKATQKMDKIAPNTDPSVRSVGVLLFSMNHTEYKDESYRNRSSFLNLLAM